MSAMRPEQKAQEDPLKDRETRDAEEPDEDVVGHVYTGALRDREQLPS